MFFSAEPLSSKLIRANGAHIPTWEFQKQTLAFGNKTFTYDFLLAKRATPILSLDFFRKFQLSSDGLDQHSCGPLKHSHSLKITVMVFTNNLTASLIFLGPL
jgi:hypothetical protein